MNQSHIREMIIKFLKRGGQWVDFEGDRLPKWKFVMQICRIIFIFGHAIANTVAIYIAGFEQSLKGVVLFLPVTVLIWIHAVIYAISQEEFIELLDSFEICFSQLEHGWEMRIFKKHHYRLWKLLNRYEIFIYVSSVVYIIIPFLFDSIMSIFGYLDEPYVVPSPFSDLINGSRDFKYYLFMFLTITWFLLICTSKIGSTGAYCIFIVYTYAFLEIFTRKVKSCDTRALNPLIDNHKLLLRLSRNVKRLYGLPCAILTSVLSACLCLCLFVAINTSDPVVFFAFSFGVLFYLCEGFVFCILGQVLENESSRIFETLYSIPWYTCSPDVRKDINMMIRQARQPLRIDYKGRSAMNLHTYMQVLHTSYTYFMLLQSLAK